MLRWRTSIPSIRSPNPAKQSEHAVTSARWIVVAVSALTCVTVIPAYAAGNSVTGEHVGAFRFYASIVSALVRIGLVGVVTLQENDEVTLTTT